MSGSVKNKTVQDKAIFNKILCPQKLPVTFSFGASLSLCHFLTEDMVILAQKFLTTEEQKEGLLKKNKTTYASFLGARLAAKAAYLKCRGEDFNREKFQALCVLKNSQGVPSLFKASNGDFLGYLSLSHGEGLAGAIFSENYSVGFDLERKDRYFKNKLLDFVFSSEEKKILNESGSWPGALSLWMAKEAAAKSWGLGLLNHLRTVEAYDADFKLGQVKVRGRGNLVNETCPTIVSLMVYDQWLLACAKAL